jgi:phosphatidate cytidylyltransferase
VILGVFYAPTPYFGMAVAIILSLAAWEWTKLAGLTVFWQRVLYIGLLWWGFAIAQLLPDLVILWVSFAWWLFALYMVWMFPKVQDIFAARRVTKCAIGFLVFIPCLHALILLHKRAPIYIIFMLFIIWAADIGAYFIGIRYGKHKLAPKVSPNKSIEGLYGGLGFAFVIALIFGVITGIPFSKWLLWAVLVVIIVFAAVLGDLFESVLKRLAGVKDSGTWLPGHGGFLDRFDSLLAAAPIFALGLLLVMK